MTAEYVHGYSPTEALRLTDQASALTDLLHCDTSYPAGSLVLEAGCGVGAQTVTLAGKSPGASFISVDISPDSLAQAKERVGAAGLTNVTFRQGDIFSLPFPLAHFDHVFVCFVLEHLADPGKALAHLGRVLKPGGTLTVIEGDHGSAYFHPESASARRAVQCLVESAAASRRRCVDRPPPLPAARRGRCPRRARLPTHGLRRCNPTGAGGRFHPEDLHGHGGRGGRGSDSAENDRRGVLGQGHPGSGTDSGAGWDLLLHVLQGRRREVTGRRWPPVERRRVRIATIIRSTWGRDVPWSRVARRISPIPTAHWPASGRGRGAFPLTPGRAGDSLAPAWGTAPRTHRSLAPHLCR